VGTFVELEPDPETRVATLRLQRPPMNALSAHVWDEIGETATEVAGRDDIGALVVWGGPEVFAAGGDIHEFPEWDYQRARATASDLQRSLDTLARLPHITIAAINGYALGGGCELAMACDFRLVADDATLGQPEIKLGLLPGGGGTQRLVRLVGLSRAKDLVLSGRLVGAEEAKAIGLVDAVHPPAEVHDRAREVAATYAGGPYALRLAKRAIDDGSELPLDQALRLERDLFAECFATEDARTGIASFIERGPGKAEFHGR
jgi:enoyl-CoA hydratase/carnithine racemase